MPKKSGPELWQTSKGHWVVGRGIYEKLKRKIKMLESLPVDNLKLIEYYEASQTWNLDEADKVERKRLSMSIKLDN